MQFSPPEVSPEEGTGAFHMSKTAAHPPANHLCMAMKAGPDRLAPLCRIYTLAKEDSAGETQRAVASLYTCCGSCAPYTPARLRQFTYKCSACNKLGKCKIGDPHKSMQAGGHQCSISCTAAWWLQRPRRGSMGRTSCIFREAAMPELAKGELPSGGDAVLFRTSGCATGGNALW